jgi:tripartite-type tricarboxylate transporter receptor subunit TctC
MMPRPAFAAASVIAMLLSAGTASGQNAADFYRDKTVNLVVGFNPGGGADTYARIVARHLGRNIPGNPAVLVRNMPGAGSVIAANHIFNVAPRNGLELGLFAGNIVVDPLIGGRQDKYDARAFNWIGAPSGESHVCLSTPSSRIKTFDDMLKSEMVVGTAGTGTLAIPLMLNGVLGARLKIVKGYAGSAGLQLAFERGEIDGFCGVGYIYLNVTRLIEPARANLLVQIGMRKHPALPQVPFIMDRLKSDADRDIFLLVFGWLDLERPIAAPPGTPADRVQTLRDSFDRAMKDPALIADLQKIDVQASPMGGAEIAKFVDRVSRTPAPVIARAAAIFGRPK